MVAEEHLPWSPYGPLTPQQPTGLSKMQIDHQPGFTPSPTPRPPGPLKTKSKPLLVATSPRKVWPHPSSPLPSVLQSFGLLSAGNTHDPWPLFFACTNSAVTSSETLPSLPHPQSSPSSPISPVIFPRASITADIALSFVYDLAHCHRRHCDTPTFI